MSLSGHTTPRAENFPQPFPTVDSRQTTPTDEHCAQLNQWGLSRPPSSVAVMPATIPIASDQLHAPAHEKLPLESVVKINVVSTAANYRVPWQMQAERESSGTGFTISQRRILTNAHVVEDYAVVRVRRYNNSEVYTATVLCVAHACDLALLTVEDDRFWQNEKLLEFGPLPHIYDDIMTVGYPIGGENVSVTRGIVSRVDTMPYLTRPVENMSDLLVLQIDAAINPGNSGGPACNSRGQVIGVTFAGLTRAQSIGYVIPLLVINMFLDQYETKRRWEGVCDLGIGTQEMMSKALRKKLHMTEQQSGLYITQVEPLGTCAGKLKIGDVLMQIDDRPIANDGTVLFQESAAHRPWRLEMSILITSKKRGDQVKLTLLRDGQEQQAVVELLPFPRLVPCFHGYDALPSYFIVGGLVFTALSIPLVNQIVDHVGQNSMLVIQKAVRMSQERSDQQYLILLRILPSEVNFGYRGGGIHHLKTVNGKEVDNLRELVKAVKLNKEEFIHFQFDDGVVVIEHDEAKATERRILKQHNIASPISDDLLDYYNAAVEEPSVAAPFARTEAGAPAALDTTRADVTAAHGESVGRVTPIEENARAIKVMDTKV
eukprot:TRINITY_DN10498_c0_g1_i4.p1 TRINITY_DN10498_c0_g1~~TRINITY_DN10498_c0_g1_i4.p1  ORF type:complete len:602 (-),score=127.79 TRINITY_DN10498_c0_g1_i4:24-1829(-)